MKPFNLKRALAGEPVVLRDGTKAYVFKDISELAKENGKEALYPLVGVTFDLDLDLDDCLDNPQPKNWTNKGKYDFEDEETEYDIVGMWQEPRRKITITIPQPLKAEEVMEQEKIYLIKASEERPLTCFIQEKTVEKEGINQSSWIYVDNGLAFASKEDAEEFLNTLKQAGAE